MNNKQISQDTHLLKSRLLPSSYIVSTKFAIMIMSYILLSTGISLASLPFRATGMFDNKVSTNKTSVVTKSASPFGKDKFFGTMQPSRSNKGEVKTYVLRVVKKLKTSDWNSLSQSNRTKLTLTKRCLLTPVSGRITSSFGMRIHPTRRKRLFHAGVDFGARRGSSIVAALGGKVAFAGWKRGYGLMIILDHGNDMKTVYAHCSRVFAKKGQVVTKGYRIAKVGSTGVATGAHLHFEVRVSGNVRNPRRYLIRN